MIPVLQEQGVLHIEQVSLALENHPGYLHRVHLPEAEKLELAQLEELEFILSEAIPLLSSHPAHDAVAAAAPAHAESTPESRTKMAKGWRRVLRTLHRRKLNIQDDMTVIRNYGRLIESITPLLLSNGAILGETARAVVLEGYDAGALEALKHDIAGGVSPACKTIAQKLDRGRVCLVITHPSELGSALGEFLSARGIKVLASPDQETRGASVDEVMRKIGGRLAEMQADLDAVLAELKTFTANEGAKLVALHKLTSDRIAQLRVVDSFAQSAMVGVIQGHIWRQGGGGSHGPSRYRTQTDPH
jgi:vacuolar-type H+-ATPase subunit I/STV1